MPTTATGGPISPTARWGWRSMYSGWEGYGTSVSASSSNRARKVAFTQSMTGATVRKLAVSSTAPPGAGANRSRAAMKTEMSARRNR